MSKGPIEGERLFVSIGVSSPERLTPLPGVLTASERMAAWAQANGYTVELINDRGGEAISIDLLRDRLSSAIEEITCRSRLRRLVVYFAGHGAALGVSDVYWILSNWWTRPTEAVSVASLQRMLEYYGPLQVSIISDACQEFSPNFIDLIGSPILDRPSEDRRRYELDKFLAAGVTHQAFMIRASDNDQTDFCLFTEVLLEALDGGADAEWFEEVDGFQAITSQMLSAYLQDQLPREAGRYGLKMVPETVAGFESDRTYYTKPKAVSQGIPPGLDAHTLDLTDTLASSIGDIGKMDWLRIPRVDILPASMPRRIERAVPRTPDDALVIEEDSRRLRRVELRDNVMRDLLEATRWPDSGTDGGLFVSGDAGVVTHVLSSFGKPVFSYGLPQLLRIIFDETPPNVLAWSDVLVFLRDGRTISLCVVQGFNTYLHATEDSVLIFHSDVGSRYYSNPMISVNLLANLRAGLLTRRDILEAAEMLRYGKHRDLTLGCVAAQFYDSVRNLSMLQKMVSYYVGESQPVPLDVVLFSGLRLYERGGRLYFFSKERRVLYPIAGRVPWMRSAWGAIETAACDSSAKEWRKSMLSVMRHLDSGEFTSLRSAGLVPLVEAIGGRLGPENFASIPDFYY
jgi:hypothetical protein